MRLDKWLWCARFFKTRTLAARAIKGGKIKLNGGKVKAARAIRGGDSIRIRKPPYEYVITVLALSAVRLSAGKAALLYAETEASIEQRQRQAEQISRARAASPGAGRRPGKRERRHIIRFTRVNAREPN